MSASEERVHDLLRAARRLMESGDRDQALRTLHKALDTDPDNSEVREEIQSIEREIAAMKVFKKTRSARAHAPEEATVPASGGFVDECIRRSQEAIDSGDEIRALQELERARRQDSENDEINRRIKVVKRSIKANNLADLGLTRLRSGDPGGAMEQAWNIFAFWSQSPALEKLVSELEKFAPQAGQARLVPSEPEEIEFEAADVVEVPPVEPSSAVIVEEKAAPRGAAASIASIRAKIAGSDYAAALEEAKTAVSRYPRDETLRELKNKLEKLTVPVQESPVRDEKAPVKAAAVPAAEKQGAPLPGEKRKKNPVLMIVIGCVLLAVIVLGLLALLKPKPPVVPEIPVDQPYTMTLLVDGPEDMSITLDGTDLYRDSTGAYIISGSDYGSRNLEIRAQGYEVYTRAVELQQGTVVSDTIRLLPLGSTTTPVQFSLLMPEGAPQPAAGEVTFLVDGEETDSLMVNLPTGMHVFQAVLEGYNSLPETVLVDTPDGFSQALALLSSETSQISLTLAGDIEGNAQFFVDGVQVGTGRRITHIDERGEHALLIRMEGREDWTRTITLGADGFSQTVAPVEIVTTGRLMIGPEPWAEVTIDGQSYGQTPLPPIELEPGTYSVTLTNPDYEDQTSSVTISLGEDSMIRYTAPERQQQPDVIEEQPVLPPFAISQSAPSIPGMAAERGDLHGYVTLDVRVATDGSVSDVTVVSDPLGLGCGQAAADAVRQWRFQPATQGGNPVEVTTTVQVRFDIQ